MISRPAQVVLSAALFLGVLGLAVAGMESCERKAEAQHETKASESKGKADAHAEVAGKADAAADEAHKRAELAEAEVSRLAGELAALKQKKQVPALPPASGLGPGLIAGHDAPGVSSAPGASLEEVVAKQDQLIHAQDAQIVALKAENLELTTSRDALREAFKAERDRATSLYLALEAQKSVAKTSLWRGRIGGVAVGFGVGFIAGRLR